MVKVSLFYLNKKQQQWDLAEKRLQEALEQNRILTSSQESKLEEVNKLLTHLVDERFEYRIVI